MKSLKQFISEASEVDVLRKSLTGDLSSKEVDKKLQGFYDKHGQKGMESLRSGVERVGKQPIMKAKAKRILKAIDNWKSKL